jgi:hypothetical protein
MLFSTMILRISVAARSESWIGEGLDFVSGDAAVVKSILRPSRVSSLHTFLHTFL